MKYNLSNEVQKAKAKNAFNHMIAKGSFIELTEKRKTRTEKQNSALHLYFTFIAENLNELGIEYQYQSIRGKVFSLRYTKELVKYFIWRPIQLALFGIESTTKIDTVQINEIVDILTKFFADEGVEIEFPSFERLMEEKLTTKLKENG